MIDRPRRDRLADEIHALAAGFITNDQFEDSLSDCGIPLLADPSYWSDAAIGPICDVAWCLYSDGKMYKLAGKHRLSRDVRRDVLRWVLFLRSNLEYEWPPIRLINPTLVSLSSLIASFFTFGILPKARFARAFAKWKESGDFAVWPFLRHADYESTYRSFCPYSAWTSSAA